VASPGLVKYALTGAKNSALVLRPACLPHKRILLRLSTSPSPDIAAMGKYT